jgi:hypothetical protein
MGDPIVLLILCCFVSKGGISWVEILLASYLIISSIGFPSVWAGGGNRSFSIPEPLKQNVATTNVTHIERFSSAQLWVSID